MTNTGATRKGSTNIYHRATQARQSSIAGEEAVCFSTGSQVSPIGGEWVDRGSHSHSAFRISMRRASWMVPSTRQGTHSRHCGLGWTNLAPYPRSQGVNNVYARHARNLGVRSNYLRKQKRDEDRFSHIETLAGKLPLWRGVLLVSLNAFCKVDVPVPEMKHNQQHWRESHRN